MKQILMIMVLLCGYAVAQNVQPTVIDSSSLAGMEMLELEQLYTKLIADRNNINLYIKQVEFAYLRAVKMQEKEQAALEDKKDKKK